MAKVVAENLENDQYGFGPHLDGLFDNVYWCPHCHIPLLIRECPLCHTQAKRCAKDLKPVFDEERKLFERMVGAKLPRFLFAHRNRVFFNGKTLFTFTIDPYEGPCLLKSNLSRIESCDSSVFLEEHAQAMWALCLLANHSVLSEIEAEAIEFVRGESARFLNREKVISFSGGKDSAVTADLVRKALGSVPLLFGDTTIEFPDTYSYIHRFAEVYGFTLFQEEPDSSFLELCQVLGPPSRIMRWCCTACKSRPINRFYGKLSADVLSFDGIRRMESNRRSSYPRVVQVQKFSRQVAARPIVQWSSFAVWLYILTNNLLYNPLYKYGYSRVGCVYCPSNTPFNDFLTRMHFPELHTAWVNYLLDYAQASGKEDPESYVLEGKWKSRNITKQRFFVTEPTRPCSEGNDVVYSFDDPITIELVEFLKPFGQVSFLSNAEQQPAFAVGSANPLTVTGVVGDTQLSVSFGKKNTYLLQTRIEKQIEKYLNCVHCGGCAGVCLQGAISIRDGLYHIDDSKCTRCGRCVTTKYLKEGCVALNFGTVKKAINRGGRN